MDKRKEALWNYHEIAAYEHLDHEPTKKFNSAETWLKKMGHWNEDITSSERTNLHHVRLMYALKLGNKHILLRALSTLKKAVDNNSSILYKENKNKISPLKLVKQIKQKFNDKMPSVSMEVDYILSMAEKHKLITGFSLLNDDIMPEKSFKSARI